MRLFIAISALLSHWRHSPGQLATLVIGLSLATALWSGVQAINVEARASYDTAVATMAPDELSVLVAKVGTMIPVALFVKLQRSGWRTSPVLEGKLRIGSRHYQILGIEPLTAPRRFDAGLPSQDPGNDDTKPTSNLFNFLSQNGIIMAAPETMQSVGNMPNLPKLIAHSGIAPGILVMDIAQAERILNKPGVLSRLIILPHQPRDRPALNVVSPELVKQQPSKNNDIARLTDSFHQNLTAFGLLSFAVGLFIVHAAIGLAFEQRRGVFRTLRVLGLTAGELTIALCAEIFTLAVISGAIGIVLGYYVAALLLPDVAATLRGLYGTQISGELAFRPQWWVAGIAIAVLGTGFASATSLWKMWILPVLASPQPRAWSLVSQRMLHIQTIAASGLLLTATFLGLYGSGLVTGFVLLGAMFLGAAMALPPLFSAVLSVSERFAKFPIGVWFWADTRQQLPGLSLALMALLLALATNIGVGTMIGSFRTTFTGWLDQRFASEFYVSAKDERQALMLRTWLEGRANAVLPNWSAEIKIGGIAGRILSVSDHATYRDNWPLLSSLDGVWDRVASREAALINEQLSRRQNLFVGDQLNLPGDRNILIAGVYSDYGNPAPQVMVASDLLVDWFPEIPRLRFGVRIAPSKVTELINTMQDEFELSDENVIEHTAIKAISHKVFERTFSVTNALNVLTLAVAGFAIFTSLLTLGTMRQPQLAPVWAMGLTRKRLAMLELLRSLLLASLTALVALPLGLMLAWILLTIINVEAFGWQLPMHLFPASWLRLGGFAILATFLAAALPAWRLSRIAPADLLKVFTHER
jgi:putative ABC transport system permease protein